MAEIDVAEVTTKTITLTLTEKEAWLLSVLLGYVADGGPFKDISVNLYETFNKAGFDSLAIEASTPNINIQGSGRVYG